MKRLVLLCALLCALGPLAAVGGPARAEAAAVPADCNHATAPGEAHCMAMVAPVPTGVATPHLAGSKSGEYLPSDLQSLYGVTAADLAAAVGTTVAVIEAGHDSSAATALASYRSQFGLPPCAPSVCFRQVDQSGGSDFGTTVNAASTGWDVETELDVEAVSALCPTCQILLVEARSSAVTALMAAVRTAVQLGAHYVSMSFGASEFPTETSLDSSFGPDPSGEGVTYVAATGDEGYLTTAEYPAASSKVVAVGGTSAQLVSGTWRQTAWSGSESGCSLVETATSAALGYLGASGACGGSRALADMSALADPDTGMYGLLSRYGWTDLGGTSLAAPLVAALYAIAGNHSDPFNAYRTVAASPSLFADITGGSTLNCLIAIVPLLCSAAPGWDGATGIGAPLRPLALAVGPVPADPAPSPQPSPQPAPQPAPQPTSEPAPQAPQSPQEPLQPAPALHVIARLVGNARVGHRLSVSLTGVPAGAAVTVRWRLGSRWLPGSGAAIRIRRPMRRHRLAARVSVMAEAGVASYTTAAVLVR